MKKFFLLLDRFTYLHIPKKLQAPREDLPRALRYLPLLGLLCGLLLYLSTHLLAIMPASGAAAILLGVNLLLCGGKLLRPLMTAASGLTDEPLSAAGETGKKGFAGNPDNEKELIAKARRFRTSRSGLIWGGIWLLSLYFIYLVYLMSSSVSRFALIAAPVVCFWLMDWLVYYFHALPPARLHLNFSRRDFIIASLLAMLSILIFSSFPLYLSTLISFLGIYLFATYRVRTLGGLDEVSYSSACAWAQILFLLAWLAFARFI